MIKFNALFRKEWLEAWRDKKVIWLPAVILLMTILQPITLYFMPAILENSNSLPDGAVMKLPIPSGGEVLASTLSQLHTIGTAIIVLACMNVIVQERNTGALMQLFTRPLSSAAYIFSKWTMLVLLHLLAFSLSYGIAWYYTNNLFTDVPFTSVWKSYMIYCLWIVLVITVTLFMGTILRRSGGVAGISILIIASIALLSTILPDTAAYLPSNILTLATDILKTDNTNMHTGIIVTTTLFFIVVLLIGMIKQFSRSVKF
ncbi:ABC transporter permease [Terribacillus sp. DMT04]|uniref:ABC transporter permease n=1 Tax=Terribacillus sp. DMT04 TaxID=2850441 RepID=UPI001C2CB1A1|nr:ABC transporter permease [Terribacillus sp. DMT04]QXE01795.1 ABC transporter permease [Terribacillus sp. DMT04]